MEVELTPQHKQCLFSPWAMLLGHIILQRLRDELSISTREIR